MVGLLRRIRQQPTTGVTSAPVVAAWDTVFRHQNNLKMSSLLWRQEGILEDALLTFSLSHFCANEFRLLPVEK